MLESRLSKCAALYHAVTNMIDFNLIDKKKDLGARRVCKISSTIGTAVMQIINGELIGICSNFMVSDVVMSTDLRHCNILITFINDDSPQEHQVLLDKLNSNQGLTQYSPSLKYIIVEKVFKKMRMRFIPQVHFKCSSL